MGADATAMDATPALRPSSSFALTGAMAWDLRGKCATRPLVGRHPGRGGAFLVFVELFPRSKLAARQTPARLVVAKPQDARARSAPGPGRRLPRRFLSMVRRLHRLYARRSHTQLFGGFLASLSRAAQRPEASSLANRTAAEPASFQNLKRVQVRSMKRGPTSMPFPPPGSSSSRRMTASSQAATYADFKSFGDLQAASHPPDEMQVKPESWSQENASTSETDDGEHDVEDDEEAFALEDQADQSDPTKTCRSTGCQNPARSRGLCPAHGGGTRCCAQGCTKHVVSGGLCVAHGGGRQCRGSPSCPSSAVSRGLCVQHGGGRKCSHEGCNKHVASGGLCRTHGGGRRCQVPDCTSSAQSRGLCYVHGGGGRCQRPGCGSSAKKGGLCIAHGGGHRCQVAGCTSSAVSGSRCRAHGGGRRCAVEGCTSSAKTGGRCIAHGGGKRCTVSGCSSSAQRLGLCKAHGGGRRCVVEACANSAVSRGRCIAHGGGKRCVVEGCKTTARKGGFCFAHGGRSTASIKSKVVSPLSAAQSTPVTAPSTPNAWPTSAFTDARSPIPALSLPPRRLLPPINTMLMANRPGILRRYAPIPPIRKPVVSFEHDTREASNKLDGGWAVTSAQPARGPGASSSRRPTRPQAPDSQRQTPTAASTRSGYSWQRLQETIRRESRANGITNDEDELEDKATYK
jgi:hypothetical protein